ncbi:Lysine exporter protein (LYSE/YGGA) [Caballeronia sordidicola]|uniref:Lysine exporter protein (LYSE/YGGA) n=2 Tax=Burkholderiaceae TaxID=119060 RepID=A0A242N2Z3_CABSO|nr:Lysine exporter protein (LYSE/YGGA) [Caballeronia sordidicola]
MIRSDGHVVDRAVSFWRVPLGALLLRGIMTNVTNPKVLLFYVAFLPQFVETSSPQKTAAFFVLGSVMVLLGFLNDSVVACCAAMVAHSLRRRSIVSRWLNRVIGATFVGMGIRLAAATRQTIDCREKPKRRSYNLAGIRSAQHN